MAMLLVAGVQARAAAPNIAEQYLLQAANQERAQRGLQKLAWDPELADAAHGHAVLLAQANQISHQLPGEANLESRAKTAGAKFSLVAENVAEAPAATTIHVLWMNSEGHRHNLLEPHENAVGISVVRRGDQLFAVEDFSEQVASVGLDEQESHVAGLLQGLGMADVSSSDDARKSCTMETGYAGSVKPWFVMRYTTSSLDLLPDQLKAKLLDKRLHRAAVGACQSTDQYFTAFKIAVLLYP